MIRNVLEHINGIGVLPVIGLLLFLTVFIGMMIRAIRMQRTDIEHMGHLPLEDGTRETTNLETRT